MTNSINFRIKGHSKSTFIEKGGGGGGFKSEQKRTGGGGPSICVRLLF